MGAYSLTKEYRRNYYLHMSSKIKNIRVSLFSYLFRRLCEFVFYFFIGWIIEKIFRSIQVKKLYLYKHKYFGKEQMIINDKIIKLHCAKGKCEGKLF